MTDRLSVCIVGLMTNQDPGTTASKDKALAAMAKLFERTPDEEAAHEAYWKKWQSDMDDAARYLEAKYEDRGLEFTSTFKGSVPVQAYGHVDGMRFYFRFRGNHASINIGPYDLDYEERFAAFQNKMAEERYQKRLKEGLPTDVFDTRHHDSPEQPSLEDDPQFYPHIMKRYGAALGKNPADTYNGSFEDGNDAIWMFSRVMDSTVDLPRSDWYSKWDRDNLYPDGTPE